MLHRTPIGGGQAVRPGPRRLVSAVLLAGAFASMAGCSGSAASAPPAPTRPTPSSTAPLDQVVAASAGRPALAVQGSTVRVSLPSGQVSANAVGPVVPPFVAPPPEVVTATFTVTLRDAVGTVPVRLSDFSLQSQTGRVVRPLLVSGEAPPPASAPAGSPLSLRLTAVLPTGEGLLVWSPNGHPVVRWDYIVEND